LPLQKAIFGAFGDIVSDQSSSGCRTHPTINPNIFGVVCPAIDVPILSRDVRGRVVNPKRTAGETTASNSFNRKFQGNVFVCQDLSVILKRCPSGPDLALQLNKAATPPISARGTAKIFVLVVAP